MQFICVVTARKTLDFLMTKKSLASVLDDFDFYVFIYGKNV